MKAMKVIGDPDKPDRNNLTAVQLRWPCAISSATTSLPSEREFSGIGTLIPLSCDVSRSCWLSFASRARWRSCAKTTEISEPWLETVPSLLMETMKSAIGLASAMLWVCLVSSYRSPWCMNDTHHENQGSTTD